MKKNDRIEFEIEDMSADGSGIGRYQGMAFFVKDAFIKDRIRAQITKLKKTYGYARLVEILEPSPYRVTPKCPLHRQCGGCQLQALAYEKQLEYKVHKVRGCLMRIGGFSAEEIPMEPAIGMEYAYRYRNKAQFPIGYDKDGRLAAGFYAARTHSLIPVDDCLLGIPQNREIMRRILNWMERYDIKPYDEQTGRGLVRHVLLRHGMRTKQIMACLVINGKSIPESKALTDSLADLEGMAGISISVNEQRSNVIMGDTAQTLWGTDYIEDYIGDIRFRISPLSFYQVNLAQTEILYRKVLEYAKLTGAETVWDLYCGIGTISLFLAQKARQVYGVEIVPQAVEDAKINAEINHISNAAFFEGKAEEVLPRMYAHEHVKKPDAAAAQEQEKEQRKVQAAQVVVVDPPRKGCKQSLLDTIVQMQPERVVYVSCDPATLARDLAYMCARGYVLKKVQIVDVFGQTVHIETCVLLSRKKAGNKSTRIEIDIDLDEADRRECIGKATYQEIKDYVWEHYQAKVSHLYIAQIKKKCGLDVGENFNKAKTEGNRVPNCPPEKERMIREALKYYGMIKED